MALSELASKRGLYLGRRSTPLHVALYRLTRGRLGGHLPGLPSARILLLDHVGAKSGARRTSPLIYCEDGGSVAVAASKAGQSSHPAWFHNLMADPETTVQVGSEVRRVRARIAGPAERDRLWPRLESIFPTYGFYRRQALPREMPIVILEPRRSPP